MNTLDVPASRLPMRVTPLAAIGALIADLLIALGAALALSGAVVGAILVLRAAQSGLELGAIGQLNGQDITRLIGADGMVALLLLQNLVFIGVAVVRVRVLRREPLSVLGFSAPQPFRLVFLGVGLGLLALLLNGIVGVLFVSAGIRQNQAALYPLFPGDYAGQALFFIGAVVLAPIGEEVLFRGYLFGSLRRLAGDSRAGIAVAYGVSALVFALSHSLAATEGLIGLLVPSFLIGLVFAWGFDRSGSLIPAIVAHAINNGIAFAALLTCVNNPGMCPQM
ncbi:CPBP family intramembrane glutamic endopeptidase [Roseiflexus castenholzii]|jgi:membrane protease YdiL (CAAX protease family)|uniref:Abortive infection protein n=1 Tax=Roseiflexus castenholzii (strain DSM 13941 / HLO8) TaxID=383372 RepID=A7NNZ6_ROSCS|nr:CPBP family intramembrane glutamic endopeptidase [Roseiflexus castenholzii]ABU59291.1 Abortive infection protein [Roseiflexus castenholzii DSM 13941]